MKRSEFGFLKHLKDHFNLSRIGDDCAVIPKDEQHDMLITSDMLVEDIDFRLQWTVPNYLGHKALAVSLSDIAAMGGSPGYSLLSIGIPEAIWKTDFLDKFYSGYMELAGRVGVELIGGDVSKTDRKIVIDSTVIGETPKGKSVMRNTAAVGDLLFVTGPLGGAAAGLRILESGGRYGSTLPSWQVPLVRQQLKPGVIDGRFLTDVATSAIDISDGLSSDLNHICEASNVGATIFAEKLPIDANLSGLGLSQPEIFDLALNGGEDFQLLFTSSPKENHSPFNNNSFAIGEIVEQTSGLRLISNGERQVIIPRAFSHFSSE